jgi:hypothetical protein
LTGIVQKTQTERRRLGALGEFKIPRLDGTGRPGFLGNLATLPDHSWIFVLRQGFSVYIVNEHNPEALRTVLRGTADVPRLSSPPCEANV